jgi:hypothetical protein
MCPEACDFDRYPFATAARLMHGRRLTTFLWRLTVNSGDLYDRARSALRTACKGPPRTA